MTPEVAEGIYAFDGATGAMGFMKATSPSSRMSAGDGRLYLVEGMGASLVARSETDGSVVWSADLMNGGFQAPVIVDGLVIVADSAGVHAFDEASGAPAWSTALTGAVSMAGSQNFSGGCGMADAAVYSGNNAPTTTIAAAAASGTLVVTSFSGITILDITDGSQVWQSMISGAMGSVREPVLVGTRVYVLDSSGLIALDSSM